MTLRDRIARAIAPYEAEPTSATLATADRVIEALREPNDATIERMDRSQWTIPSDHRFQLMRAAYAAIWSDRDK